MFIYGNPSYNLTSCLWSHYPSMDHSFLSLVLVLLHATVASASLLVSIDCGASVPHTDENGIKWVPDTPYIKGGETHTVKTSDPIPDRLKTLRVFTSRKKNCYPITVQGVTQILLRASFYYGNYDGKSSPPAFELMFDGVNWATVETQADGEVYYEAVFVVGNATTVCVAQSKPGQLPFISAIQVSELEPGMYANSDANWMSALFLHRRVAFGAPQTVRHPDDPYDRIWEPSRASNSLNILETNITSIDIILTDDPPLAALQTAVTPAGPSVSIPLSTNLPPSPVKVYINLYIADMTGDSFLDTRSVAVYMDGDRTADPVSLIPGVLTEYYVNNLTASDGNVFTLEATAESTLPPVVNAMEVFSVRGGLDNATDSLDLHGLKTLKNQFDVLKDWNGDPCLPKSYNWDWVGCSSDDPPRITALYLGGLGLSGEIPDFSILTALETIDMHNNSLTGGIPEFLGELRNLKELNLADNSLSGPIPSSLANNRIKLVITGNPNLCDSDQSCQTFSSDDTPNSPVFTNSRASSTTTTTKNNLGLILGLTIPLFFMLVVVVSVTLFLRSRRGATTMASVNPGRPKVAAVRGGPPIAGDGEEDDKVKNADEEVENEVVLEMEEAETHQEGGRNGQNV